MSELNTRIHGFAGSDARLGQGNQPAASVGVAHTARIRQQDGSWTDGETTWVTVTCWDAERRDTRSLMAVRKGDRVFAEGTPKLRAYRNSDGQTVAELQINNPRLLVVEPKQRAPEPSDYGAPQNPVPDYYPGGVSHPSQVARPPAQAQPAAPPPWAGQPAAPPPAAPVQAQPQPQPQPQTPPPPPPPAGGGYGEAFEEGEELPW